VLDQTLNVSRQLTSLHCGRLKLVKMLANSIELIRIQTNADSKLGLYQQKIPACSAVGGLENSQNTVYGVEAIFKMTSKRPKGATNRVDV
jgi:hypothetical protein